ncbi:hypothetical protein [Persicobacter psychrovividus]|uniref:Flagellar FliJ protein n=1 Tax=Persicobacter psychrovividus TaxID=387638 RepID=A0ABN6L6K2_9BACT|nr:hypothetical protein PEPS_11000 [Persicobacter psychrovividus]
MEQETTPTPSWKSMDRLVHKSRLNLLSEVIIDHRTLKYNLRKCQQEIIKLSKEKTLFEELHNLLLIEAEGDEFSPNYCKKRNKSLFQLQVEKSIREKKIQNLKDQLERDQQYFKKHQLIIDQMKAMRLKSD